MKKPNLLSLATRLYVVSIALLFTTMSHAAPVAIWNTGIPGLGYIERIENIDIGGTLYDASFVEPALITDAAYISDLLTFNNETDAALASTALLSVIESSGFELADQDPDYLGCFAIQSCWHHTVYSVLDGTLDSDFDLLSTSTVENYTLISGNPNQIGGFIDEYFSLKNPPTGYNYNVVVWTQTAVPLPPAVWLFGTGLLGLAGIARRVNKKTERAQ